MRNALENIRENIYPFVRDGFLPVALAANALISAYERETDAVILLLATAIGFPLLFRGLDHVVNSRKDVKLDLPQLYAVHTVVLTGISIGLTYAAATRAYDLIFY